MLEGRFLFFSSLERAGIGEPGSQRFKKKERSGDKILVVEWLRT